MRELTNRLSGQVAQSLDERLRAGIIRTIGDDWTLESLKGRLMTITYRYCPYTDYAIDGRPFLRVWPGQLVWEGSRATWRQEYQELTP